MLTPGKQKKLNSNGQAMVETALVVFLLVVLVFGMTEFGRAMYIKNSLGNAARAGARAAVVKLGITTCGTPSSPIALNSPCTGDAPIFDAVNSSIVWSDKSETRVAVEILDQSGNPTALVTGAVIRVTVQDATRPLVAIMRDMISPTLHNQASMRYER